MTDFRKFCWGTFIGMGTVAALDNHGLWYAVPGTTATDAIVVSGLLLGCLSVLIFGCERREP